MNAAIECDENAEIRAVLITGEGKAFRWVATSKVLRLLVTESHVW